ncbi:unnamed protein product [Calypogeia fissa]
MPTTDENEKTTRRMIPLLQSGHKGGPPVPQSSYTRTERGRRRGQSNLLERQPARRQSSRGKHGTGAETESVSIREPRRVRTGAPHPTPTLLRGVGGVGTRDPPGKQSSMRHGTREIRGERQTRMRPRLGCSKVLSRDFPGNPLDFNVSQHNPNGQPDF